MTLSLTQQILDNAPREFVRRRKPSWLRAKLPGGAEYTRLRRLIDEHALHTVCESAKSPNMGECWSRGTATLMILGNVCTRSCGFCHIQTGRPSTLDRDEPVRVGKAVAMMGLRHIVITSVNRDELVDGGAEIWAQTITQIRQQAPQTTIEVLIPDFCGDWDALQVVIDQRPDIINHNMETVRSLYSVVRPQAKYDRSIELLRRCKQQGLVVKTGIMVGIGETDPQILQLMHHVVEGIRLEPPSRADTDQAETSAAPDIGMILPSQPAGPSGRDKVPAPQWPTCDILTIGQYLQPTSSHLPVSRWVRPRQFAQYKEQGEAMGFRHVESGPLVRSSYHAEDQVLRMDSPHH